MIRFEVWDGERMWASDRDEELPVFFISQEGQVYRDGEKVIWQDIKEKNPEATPRFSTYHHDANGKEIFQGDIIFYEDCPDDLWIVEWEGNRGRWAASYKGEKEWEAPVTVGLFESDEKIYIVGNIYQNPELMKGA